MQDAGATTWDIRSYVKAQARGIVYWLAVTTVVAFLIAYKVAGLGWLLALAIAPLAGVVAGLILLPFAIMGRDVLGFFVRAFSPTD